MTTILPGEYLEDGERRHCDSIINPENADEDQAKCDDPNWLNIYNPERIQTFLDNDNPGVPPNPDQNPGGYLPLLVDDNSHLDDNPNFNDPNFTGGEDGDPPGFSDVVQLKTKQFANYVATHGIPESEADQELLYNKFNVCGRGKWFSSATEVAPFTEASYRANQCNYCPPIGNDIFNDLPGSFSDHYDQGTYEDMYEQCYEGTPLNAQTEYAIPQSYAPLTQWFPNQLERNMNAQEIAASGDLLGAERGNIDWKNSLNDESVSNNWSSRVGPVPNSELMILYPELDYTGLTCLNGQPCGSLNDVKLKIFSDLGISNTDCSGLTWSTMDEEGNVREPPPVCTQGDTFGENPQAIVPEMVGQWTREQLQNPATHLRGAGMDDFVNSFFSGQAQNPEFEMCINNIFETNEEDRRILRRIKGYSSGLLEFTDDDIEYVRRKMLKFIFAPRSQVANCLDDLYINANQICTDGLTDKMSKVAFVLFYIVGIQIDLADLDSNDEKREKMGLLMDKLGPLVPQLIKRIIEVSKYEESLRCGGDPTNNTLLMERLFDDIFVKSGQDVNVDLGIDMDYFLSMTNQEFGKFVVVAGLGLKYLTTFFAL